MQCKSENEESASVLSFVLICKVLLAMSETGKNFLKKKPKESESVQLLLVESQLFDYLLQYFFGGK